MFSRLDSLLALVLVALAAGCGGPFLVLPGGKLEGTMAAAPDDWSVTREVDTVQLETRPADPYSVNIWMIGKGPHVYVATGDDPTGWSEHLDRNPDVRLRVRGVVYELEAQRVVDLDEKLAIGDEYVQKYDVDADDNWVQDGQLFRLDRR